MRRLHLGSRPRIAITSSARRRQGRDCTRIDAAISTKYLEHQAREGRSNSLNLLHRAIGDFGEHNCGAIESASHRYQHHRARVHVPVRTADRPEGKDRGERRTRRCGIVSRVVSASRCSDEEKKYYAKSYRTNCHIAKSACPDSQRRGYVAEATSLYVFDRQSWTYRIPAREKS